MPSLQRMGKDKVLNHHHEVPYRVLEHKYNFGDKKSGNMIVHWDNLEALKSLLPQYEGKIKCCYIDPPYNTWWENWVYNDSVNHPKIKKWLWEVVGKEGDDLTRHDKWLCMMYPRLKMLHKLLDEKWVIFISIDDNEYQYLKIICNEIFWINEYVGTFVWEKKKKWSHLNNFTTTIKEYIICYCKNSSLFWWLVWQIVKEKETYPCLNPGNSISDRIIPKWTKSTFREKNYFLAKWSKISAWNMELKLKSDLVIEESKLKENCIIEAEWRYTQKNIDEYAKLNELYLTRDLYLRREVTEPRYKMLKDILYRVDREYIIDLKNQIISEYEEKDPNQDVIKSLKEQLNIIEGYNQQIESDNLYSWWWWSNEDWDEEQRLIFWKKIFDFPKPVKLIQKLILSARMDDCIILDSFAGTGTTAHAVLNLNKKDWWKRRFILIEMEDYAETITAERARRAIKWYWEWAKKVEWTWWGFDYYTLWEALFDEDDNLNENIDLEIIKQYIRYTETQTNYIPSSKKYLLGTFKNTEYYFYYEKDRATVLDLAFVGKLGTTTNYRLIYADICLLSKSFLAKNNIIFKKIPRDITRF